MAAVVVPPPDNDSLAVLTSAISVQDVPLYCSTLLTLVVVYPETPKAAVCLLVCPSLRDLPHQCS